MAEHKDPYSHYCNHECEYFPCHKVPEGFDFNCLFCYCPLYALGKDCGGNFRYTESGIKDCSGCMIPHEKENFGRVTGRFQDLCARICELDRKKE